ncbi:hypothetical protein FSP39_024149 [Pinctada imbricata]|uniref:Uncharacterized protein n=1 Tax=Pinctada imbricata TaxID=66713 RepID=A0AA88YGD5_PINIB|nr:hypothetical protein FSP39_024149 [Pinctada imbricata]
MSKNSTKDSTKDTLIKRKMSITPEKPPSKRPTKTTKIDSDESGDTAVLRCAIMKVLMDEQVLSAICEQILSGVVAVIKPDIDSQISDQVSESVENEVSDLNQKIASKDREIAELNTRIQKLEARAEEQEQYSRRTCLRFSNIPYIDGQGNTPKSPWDFDTDKIVFDMCSAVGVKVGENEIGRSHIVGEPKNGKCQIIARFQSYRVRQHVYENRFKLAKDSQKRFINEDLTKFRFKTVRHLAKLKSENKIHKYWTQDGRIFMRVRERGPKLLIKNIDDAESRLDP